MSIFDNDSAYVALVAAKREADEALTAVQDRRDEAGDALAGAERARELQLRESARRGDVSGVARDTADEERALTQADEVLQRAEAFAREADEALRAWLGQPEQARQIRAAEARARLDVITELVDYVEAVRRIVGGGEGLVRVVKANGQVADSAVLAPDFDLVIRETERATRRELAENTTGLRRVGLLVQRRDDKYAHNFFIADAKGDQLPGTAAWKFDPQTARAHSAFPLVASERRDLFLGNEVEAPHDWPGVEHAYEVLAANDAGVLSAE